MTSLIAEQETLTGIGQADWNLADGATYTELFTGIAAALPDGTGKEKGAYWVDHSYDTDAQ